MCGLILAGESISSLTRILFAAKTPCKKIALRPKFGPPHILSLYAHIYWLDRKERMFLLYVNNRIVLRSHFFSLENWNRPSKLGVFYSTTTRNKWLQQVIRKYWLFLCLNYVDCTRSAFFFLLVSFEKIINFVFRQVQLKSILLKT